MQHADSRRADYWHVHLWVVYRAFSCDELRHEISALARWEVCLQRHRNGIKKSNIVQAILLSFGQGDGIESAEFASAQRKGDCTPIC